MKKLRAGALLFFILGAIALSMSVIQLWWGTWGTVAIYFLVALVLVGLGVLVQVWHLIPRREKKVLPVENVSPVVEVLPLEEGQESPTEKQPSGNLYTDRATTPLKWHKFFCWFSLPVGTLVNIGGIVDVMTSRDDIILGQIPPVLYALSITPSIIQIILAITLIIGLSCFKRYGYITLYISFSFLVLMNILLIVISADIAVTIGESLGFLIVWIPTIIYYRKRRLLFTSY